MGYVETDARRKRRKNFIQQAVLTSISGVGILAIAAVAPNTLQLLGSLGRKNYRFTYQTKSVLSRLAAKGLVRFINRGGIKSVEITAAGKRSVEHELLVSQIHAKPPKRWDKRWRLVMFDIPERRKRDRDTLRRMMLEVGFCCFQDSVWMYPYDCEDLVALLKIDMHLGNAVRYAVVETLENDGAFKKHFGLR